MSAAKSPDCRTVGSIPAKATKADELLNLFISLDCKNGCSNHAYSGNGMDTESNFS